MMPDCDPEGRIFQSTHIPMKDTFSYTPFISDFVNNTETSVDNVRHIIMTLPWRLVTALHSLTSTLTMACVTSYTPVHIKHVAFSIVVLPRTLGRTKISIQG